MRSRIVLMLGSIIAFVAAGWFFTWDERRSSSTEEVYWTKVYSAETLEVYRGKNQPSPYLVVSHSKALLIDAPANTRVDPKFSVQQVLLTHHHRDSVGGVQYWLDQKIPVRAPKLSAEWLNRESVTKFWKDSIPLRNSRTAYFVVPSGFEGIDYSLEDQQTFEFEGHKITVVATPGHSRDHVSFSVTPKNTKNGPLVFSGDALTGDGKLWTPYTTDWDHWTDAGLKPAAESLRKMANLKPHVLFPTHGPVVTQDPKSLLERAASAVEEVGFLKSFERFTNRVGNPPQYDFLVPKEQVGSAGDKPWSKVSEHVWITGNTYVIASKQNQACLVLDPWGQRSVDQVEKLRKAEKLGPIEVVVFSHAHYDHYDGVYTLPGREGYKVWSLDIVAEPLQDPIKLRAPFLDERPIVFDRILKDQEQITWRDYAFTFHALPGQTAFTCGIAAMIDGKRCLFTADNFFHQNQYSGSGGWMGLNRSSPVVYGQSAQKVLDQKPEWILAEHGGPYVFNAEDYQRRVKWGETAGKAADAVCVSGNHRDDWNPHRISVEPVLVRAKAGERVKVKITYDNNSAREQNGNLLVESPWVMGDALIKMATNARQKTTQIIELNVPQNQSAGRYVIPVRGEEHDFSDAFLAIDITP